MVYCKWYLLWYLYEEIKLVVCKFENNHSSTVLSEWATSSTKSDIISIKKTRVQTNPQAMEIKQVSTGGGRENSGYEINNNVDNNAVEEWAKLYRLVDENDISTSVRVLYFRLLQCLHRILVLKENTLEICSIIYGKGYKY